MNWCCKIIPHVPQLRIASKWSRVPSSDKVRRCIMYSENPARNASSKRRCENVLFLGSYHVWRRACALSGSPAPKQCAAERPAPSNVSVAKRHHFCTHVEISLGTPIELGTHPGAIQCAPWKVQTAGDFVHERPIAQKCSGDNRPGAL